MDKIVIKHKDIGECKIDIDRLAKKWNNLFWLSQWHDEYRLIKYTQKNSPITTIKVSISKSQAEEIIKKLGLVRTQDSTFRNAASWRKSNYYG